MDTMEDKGVPGLTMSAKELMEYAAQVEATRASKGADTASAAQRARKELIDRLSRPTAITDEMRAQFAAQVKQAAIAGKVELMVLRFPVDLCTDKGRAINNAEPNWPETLTGTPKQVYDLWAERLRPNGYRISAMIIEWPNGMPGDVGLFLKWT
jgi:hypothetical protein